MNRIVILSLFLLWRAVGGCEQAGRLNMLLLVSDDLNVDLACYGHPEMPVPEELDYDMWLGPAAEKPYTEKRVRPRHKTKARPGWICIQAS